MAEKKVRDEPAMKRQDWVDKNDELSVVRQCLLAGVSRSPVYTQSILLLISNGDLFNNGLIDEEYTRHPFYGSRRMVVILAKSDHIVNRKRVQYLMR